MADQLQELADILAEAFDELLRESDAAREAGDTAKAKVAEAEADRINILLSRVQVAINNGTAVNLNAVAARLQESINAQRAIGLKTARKILEDAVGDLPAGTGSGAVSTGGGGTGTSGGATGTGEGTGTSAPIEAKPGPHQSVINILIAGALEHKLDPMMVLTIVKIESNFDPTARSPLSSAAGLYQFIDSTWIAEGGKKFGSGSGHAARAPISMQVEIGCGFLVKLLKSVKTKLGDASTMMVYMAHQQGLGGALKILKADPSTAIELVIGDAAARNNGFAGMTVAETIEKFRTLVRVKGDQAAELVVPVPLTPAAAGGAANAAGAADAPMSMGPFAQRSREVALTEMEMFARRNGAIVRENQTPLEARVFEYFRFVDRGDVTDTTAVPWSAAYMSFVMHRAGATNEQFPKSAGHARYILASLRNRIANRFDASIVYFDRNEKAPRLGDLVGFSDEVRNRAAIEAFLLKPPKEQFFSSHTDLVVNIDRGEILVVGGNVSQTITTKRIRVDTEGMIVPSEKHFFLLRVNI